MSSFYRAQMNSPTCAQMKWGFDSQRPAQLFPFQVVRYRDLPNSMVRQLVRRGALGRSGVGGGGGG